MLNEVTRITRGEKEILLIGTAHVSKESVDLVEKTIDSESPDAVAVELCEQRYHALSEKKKWDESEITRVIKEGRGYMFLMQLLLSNFQRRIGDEIGVKPGAEMISALDKAREKGIRIELVDRDIKTTLKRAVSRMGLREKWNVFFGLFMGIFGGEEVDEKAIEQLKDNDVLTQMMEELGREIPSIKEVLIDERDRYIADKIALAEGRKIVAVVGAGHVAGIKRLLESDTEEGVIRGEIERLDSIPEKTGFSKYAGKALGYAVPLLLIAVMAWAFSKGIGEESLIKWILLNGSGAAIGAALALAHPLSIVTAFVAAPIGTIHPLLAVGWFAGAVETKLRKPRVKDFEDLAAINSVWDFWRNRVTRILLVMALANLGGLIGNGLAGYSILTDIL